MIDVNKDFMLKLEKAYKTFCIESKKNQNNKHSYPKVPSSKKKIKNNNKIQSQLKKNLYKYLCIGCHNAENRKASHF